MMREYKLQMEQVQNRHTQRNTHTHRETHTHVLSWERRETQTLSKRARKVIRGREKQETHPQASCRRPTGTSVTQIIYLCVPDPFISLDYSEIKTEDLLLSPANLHTHCLCVCLCVHVCLCPNTSSVVVEAQVVAALWRERERERERASEAMLDRKQHLVSNRGFRVEGQGGGGGVPSALQRRHGRNWTHKSLWLSHLDEQCSQYLQGEGGGRQWL